MLKKIILLLVISLTTACTSLSSHNSLYKPTDQVYSSYQLKNNSSNEAIDPQVAAIFEAELKKQLDKYGYQEGSDITVQYDIKAYDPGNRALRIFVGFGAGKGTMEVETTLIDKHGNNLGYVNNEVALKMGFFGGSLEKIIRRSAIYTAKSIYKSKILTK